MQAALIEIAPRLNVEDETPVGVVFATERALQQEVYEVYMLGELTESGFMPAGQLLHAES